ncbi:hypothetical protein QUA04_23830 [Microcoleus sp. S13_C5]
MTEEGSSATDYLTDVTDVRKKKEERKSRKKEEGRKSMVSEFNLKSQISNCLS